MGCFTECSSLFLRFEITHDPEGWLAINHDTGAISAKKKFNIQSPYVKNNKYTALIKVTDQGKRMNVYTTVIF